MFPVLELLSELPLTFGALGQFALVALGELVVAPCLFCEGVFPVLELSLSSRSRRRARQFALVALGELVVAPCLREVALPVSSCSRAALALG